MRTHQKAYLFLERRRRKKIVAVYIYYLYNMVCVLHIYIYTCVLVLLLLTTIHVFAYGNVIVDNKLPKLRFSGISSICMKLLVSDQCAHMMTQSIAPVFIRWYSSITIISHVYTPRCLCAVRVL